MAARFFFDIAVGPEDDAFAWVERGENGVEVIPDNLSPDARVESGRGHYFASEAIGERRSLGLRLQLPARASASVLIGRVKRGIGAAFGMVSCKVCKSIVMALVRAALIMAGVPFPATGTDLSAVQAAIETALDSMKNGNISVALQNLAALLPSSVWDAIKQALHVVNWIFDSIDQLLERVCRQLGLCPAPTPAPTVP